MTVDDGLIRQIEQHIPEAWAALMNSDPSLGTSTETIAGATAFHWPQQPNVLWNRVMGLGNDHAPTDDEIDAILDVYRHDGLPCAIGLSPLTDEAAIGRQLSARGLHPATEPHEYPSRTVLVMTADRWTPPPANPAVTVEPLDAGNRDEWVAAFLEGFEMEPPLDRMILASLDAPGVRCFLARVDGEPAGTAQLIVKASVGGLFAGSTVDRFRRRGVHTALITERIRAGIDAGLNVFTSQTHEPWNQSHRDLDRQGLALAYEHVNWYLPPAPSYNS